MVNPIYSELNGINDLKSLNNFIDKLEVKDIGIWGGRKFIDKNKDQTGELALNDIVRKFDRLKQGIEDNQDETLAIRRKIYELDDAANQKLSHKNLFTRIITQLRSWMGPAPKITHEGLFSSHWSRRKVLQSLINGLDGVAKTQYLLEELFDEAGRSIKNEQNTEQFRKVRNQIIEQLKNPTNDNARHIIKSFRELFSIKANSFFGESFVFFKNRMFLEKLLYLCRKHPDFRSNPFIRDQFSPILALTYFYVYEDFKAKAQDLLPQDPPPIRNIEYLDYEDWSFDEDQELSDKVNQLLKEIKVPDLR